MDKSYYLRYQIRPSEIAVFPLDWNYLFDRSAPLAVEIGFGNGAYLVNWAQQKLHWNFVGIELSLESMERIQKRIYHRKLTNVRVIHEDAGFAIQEFFADNSISHIIMNFPDPWPKDRHKNRRLLNEKFLEVLSAVLKKNGFFELITDQEWYAEHAFNLFVQSSFFNLETKVEKNPQRPITTKYQQKWSEMGRNNYRVLAKKVIGAKITRLLEDATMPHVFIDKEISKQNIETLQGVEYREEDKLFAIKRCYQDIQNRKYLLKVVAKDLNYSQNFYVQISKHKDQRWIVKLDQSNQPYRTPAVKMAIREIGVILK